MAALLLITAASVGVYRYQSLQERLLSGIVVTAENAVPLEGATVEWLGATVQTNSEGQFELQYRLVDLPTPLKASRGELTVRLEVSRDIAQGPVEIRLQPPAQDLTVTGEVVQQGISVALQSPPVPGSDAFWVRYYDWIRFGVTAAPTALFAVWALWLYTPRLHLVRWRAANLRLREIRVSGKLPSPLPHRAWRLAAERLRIHRWVESTDIDPQKTVVESARRLGMLTLAQGQRRALPEYLVLVDRSSARDQRARYFDEILQTLRDEHVPVVEYMFEGEPLWLRPVQAADAQPVTLRDLTGRYADYRLLIFSDAEGFFGSFTGRPGAFVENFATWEHKAIFLSGSARDKADPVTARARFFSGAGFLVAPPTAEGLRFVANEFQNPRQAEPARSRGSRYPPSLMSDPDRWLARTVPSERKRARVVAELRRYLGRDGFRWLASCSVYPEVRWGLTLYLGGAMIGERVGEETLLRLVRLPWMRAGFFPDWLRASLINALPDEELAEVRRAMEHLLLSALSEQREGFALELSAPQPRPWWQPALLRNLFRSGSGPGPVRDHVLISVLRGEQVPELAVETPGGLRQLLQRFAQPNRPMAQAGAALMLAALGWWLTGWLEPSQAQPIAGTFAADKSVVEPGEEVTLSWQVQGADGIDLQPISETFADRPQLGTIGSVVVSPDVTTEYTLAAFGGELEAVGSVTVTVGKPVDVDKPEESRRYPRGLLAAIEKSSLADPAIIEVPDISGSLIILGSHEDPAVAVRETERLRADLPDVKTYWAVNAYFAPALGPFTDSAEASRRLKEARTLRNDAYAYDASAFPYEIRVVGTTPPLSIARNERDGLEYVLIPAGDFQMGCVPSDDSCGGDENPRHAVQITKDFWIGRTEVTVGAYEEFAEATSREMPEAPDFNSSWGKKTHPINRVTWDEAKAYCSWTGGRLPTEAEWEYAARGGEEGLKYPRGGKISGKDANYVSNVGGTSAADRYPANGFGLRDMAGNVLEWVGDWYDEDYYKYSPAADPQGPASGDLQVLRGGAWGFGPQCLRASNRGWGRPDVRYDGFGFRCAQEVVSP